MSNDAVIKYKFDWIKTYPMAASNLADLKKWRQILYNLKLIGASEDGISYGNLSKRFNNQEFIITGSQTGSVSVLTEYHFTRVVDYDLEANYLKCEGPMKASSESLTHAIIYQSLPQVNGIIHIHSKELWDKLIYNIPTTAKNVEYGTPAMAYEVYRLLKTTNLKNSKIFVMGGHEDGIFAFGKDLNEAANIILLA